MSAHLGELVKVQTGKLDANASSPDGAYPFFTCAREPLRIDRWKYDLDAVLVAGNGDLNVKHYNGKFEAYQRTYILNVKDERRLNSRFLYYFMDRYLEKLREQSIGGIIKYIKLGMLTEAEIPLPPLEEQRRIAAILDQADALRRLRHRTLTHLNTLAQSIFHEMFGDPRTNPKGWPLFEFVKIADVRLGKMLDKGKKRGDLQLPYLRNANVRWFDFDLSDVFEMDFHKSELERFAVEKGDLLICEGGEPGRCAIWDRDDCEIYYQKALHRARVFTDKVRTEFVAHWFYFAANSGMLTDSISTATIAHLTSQKIKKLEIYIPPVDLQSDFCERIMIIRAKEELARKAAGEGERLFTSLQHRAFRGEL